MHAISYPMQANFVQLFGVLWSVPRLQWDMFFFVKKLELLH